MGWGRTLLLGDIGNRLDIGDLEQDVAAMRNQLWQKDQLDQSQDQTLQQLQADNRQLKLYLATLLRLLIKKNLLSPQELAPFVDLIDE